MPAKRFGNTHNNTLAHFAVYMRERASSQTEKPTQKINKPMRALAKTGVVVAVTSACVRACASVRRVPNSPSPYVRTERVCLRSDWLHFAVDLARTLLCEVSCHVNGDCATCVLCAYPPPRSPQTATHACLSYTCAHGVVGAGARLSAPSEGYVLRAR